MWLDAATLKMEPRGRCQGVRMRTAFLWIGVLLFAGGMVAGFVPLGSQGTNCGSAFRPHHEYDLWSMPNDCDAVRSEARTLALTCAIVGAGVVLVEVAVRSQASSREHRTILGRPARRPSPPDDGEPTP